MRCALSHTAKPYSDVVHCRQPVPATDRSHSAAIPDGGQLGWHRSLESLYKRDRPLLLRFATRMLHDSSEAEDAVQEVFWKLLRLGNHERRDRKSTRLNS